MKKLIEVMGDNEEDRMYMNESYYNGKNFRKNSRFVKGK